MKWEDIKDRWSMFGWTGLLAYFAHQWINRIFYFDYLCLMTLTIDDADATYFAAAPDCEAGFLSEKAITDFAAEPKYQLTADFLPLALKNKDQCYALQQDRQLVSCSWYSTQPTKVTSDYKIHCPADYIYVHRGYTNPDFRGQRLHAFGMAHALQHYSEKNYRGLMSIVGGENTASLKSTTRLGFQIVGKIYLFACLNHFFVYHDRGTRNTGAWLSPLRQGFKSYCNGPDRSRPGREA